MGLFFRWAAPVVGEYRAFSAFIGRGLPSCLMVAVHHDELRPSLVNIAPSALLLVGACLLV